MFQMDQVIKYDPSSNPDKPQRISLASGAAEFINPVLANLPS
jgi:hypothetical protein